MQKLCVFIALACLCQLTLAQRSLNTLELQRANAAELITAIRPHLSPGSSISQFRNTLVINATEAEWQTIVQLVKQLDQTGKQLLISVRTDNDQLSNESRFRVDGNWGNDRVRISTSPQGLKTETHTRVTLRNQSTSQTGSNHQQLRATEGYPAYISTGQAVPYRSNSQYGTVTQFEDVTSGFYVTARVDDNTVILTIDQKNNRQDSSKIKTQQLKTRVSGKLGEWIAIGNLNGNKNFSRSEILTQAKAGSASSSPIYLKVDLAN
jgi:hypothetical protein